MSESPPNKIQLQQDQVEENSIKQPSGILQSSQKLNTTIDDIMQKVGDSGYYQKRQMFFIWVTFIINGLNFFLIPATTYAPAFLNKQGEVITEDDFCKSGGSIDGSIYQNAPAEFKLYCDKIEIRNLLQLIGMAGAGIGVLLINQFSDNYSRKNTIIISWFVGSLSTIIYAVTPYESLLLITNFGMGVGLYVFYILFLVQITELSPVYRVIGIPIGFVICSVTEMLIYVIILITENWRYQMLYFVGIPSAILFVFSFYLIDDQPPFLIIKDKQKCLEILQKIARINGREEIGKQITIDELKLASSQIPTSTKRYTYIDLFIYKSQLKIAIPLSIALFFLQCLYYGSQLSLGNVGVTFQMNCVYIGISELFGYIFSNYVCVRYKRRLFGVITFFIASIFIILNGVFEIPPDCQPPDQNCYQKSLQIVFTCLARFIISFSFSFILIQAGEAFPTTLKAIGYGFCNGFCFLGGIVSPYVISISQKYEFNPMYSLGITGIIGCLGLLFSEETFNQPCLPEIPELMDQKQDKATAIATTEIITVNQLKSLAELNTKKKSSD